MKFLHLFAPLLVAGSVLVSCADDSARVPAGPPPGPPSFAVLTVPTQTVTTQREYPARLTGIVNSEVRAKISGYVTEVLVDEGQRVRRGQLLFRLETQSLNQDAAAARANVNAAQVEVNKLEPLVEKNIISNVQLETARARLQQAESGLDGISANINYGRIVSPIDGYLGRIRLRKGSLVSPSSQEPLTTVSDISKVYAYFSMNEGEYFDFFQQTAGETMEQKVDNLPPVALVLSNGSPYTGSGTIETVINRVNDQTGTVQFRAVFDNPAGLLSDGNSGTIRLPQTFTDAVVVPKTTTYEQQGRTYVYKVNGDSTAVSAPITIAAEVDNLFVVSAGVTAGDRIVATGIAKLRGGTKVKPVQTAFDSIAQPLPTVFR
ncbi:membrane fusion protein (multidrug efflux system) [Lewinella aquimaris]|uniref:Membrane fusion protein (Multidrug efflux system) n=1 Tax=Neolewinella aquimaris TaxID=1835722 RepID=A0A840E865_9BACT|nr:efflux RND transporter periplasmic adaptor subunit [Neolewinella aquimaris]MBB4079795.1 membrane fusion protein (multidrug efflux system) [Neolewinella aquimaris]